MGEAFWRGKRVLVTGHSGFKGGWLTLWLTSLGAEVSAFSLAPPTDPSLCRLAEVEKGVDAVQGDVRDLPAISAFVQRHRPAIVFHLAAQALVRPSYVDPVATYATNVMGTVHLLEAIRQCGGVKAAVMVTSDKCYENREWVWGYRENEPMGGHDPYSNSKGCAELVTAAYRKSFLAHSTTALASARAGNVIGGGDWAVDRLVPDMVRALMQDQSVAIRSPGAIRPWQHVLEPLSGYLLLAQKLYEEGSAYAEGWNFGPADEDARPVSHLVARIIAHWGDGARWHLDARQHPHEAHYLKLDCSKARQTLGWRPRLSLEQALEWTVKWYKSYRAGGDLRAACLGQIEAYEGMGSV